jgi:general secretion pathway protein C
MIKAARLRRPRLALSAPTGMGRHGPALAAGLLWLAAGLSAGYWVLQAWGRSPVTPVSAVAEPLPQTDVASVARVLGAVPQSQPVAAAPVSVASRLSLLGVVSRPGQRGAALIALDGQPPRPYTVGATLEGGLVLQSVERRSVKLGPERSGPSTLELTLPPQPE